MLKNIKFYINHLLLLIIYLQKYQILSNKIYPLYNFIITSNLNHEYVEDFFYEYFHFSLATKGVGIIFDYNSEINLIPSHLFRQIKRIMDLSIMDIYSIITKKNEIYEELIIFGEINDIISYHYITERIGITIPIDYLFNRTGFEKFSFIFLTQENQENIVIGKNLIDLMKIEFNENGDFIINNKEFITDIKD